MATTTKTAPLALAASKVQLRLASIVVDAGLAHAVEDEALALLDAIKRQESAEEAFLVACSESGVPAGALFDESTAKRFTSDQLARARDARVMLDRASAVVEAERQHVARRLVEIIETDEVGDHFRALSDSLVERVDEASRIIGEVASTLVALDNVLREVPSLRVNASTWKSANARTFGEDTLAALRSDAARLARVAGITREV